MNWSRVPTLGSLSAAKSSYLSAGGEFRIVPEQARSRTGKKLKRVVWRLYEGGRAVGRPFNSARLAKAFAEAFAALGADRDARAKFLSDGAGWCYDKEREWRADRYEQERYR